MNNKKSFFISKIVLLIFFSLFIFSCSHTIHIQPHVSPVSAKKIVGDEAGVYISPLDLSGIHTDNLFFGGYIRVPLGTPLKDCAQEAFAPFFRRVFLIGTKDFKAAQYIIEVSLANYEVTGGLDTHLTIMCSISTSERKIFAGDFIGDGSGTAAAGLLGESLGREQIRKSTEEAFVDAFRKAQTKFNESLSE
ncbi:hypothetical protein ACFL4Z_01125 [candidate division KSB1 bacterium]